MNAVGHCISSMTLDRIALKLEELANGMENCIENACLRNDAYDVGYMTAMLGHINEIRESLKVVSSTFFSGHRVL